MQGKSNSQDHSQQSHCQHTSQVQTVGAAWVSLRWSTEGTEDQLCQQGLVAMQNCFVTLTYGAMSCFGCQVGLATLVRADGGQFCCKLHPVCEPAARQPLNGYILDDESDEKPGVS